jgi:hypothetical protein
MISWTDVSPVEGAECKIINLTTLSLVHNIHSKEWAVSADPNIFPAESIPLSAKDLDDAKREVMTLVKSTLLHMVRELDKCINTIDVEHCDEGLKTSYYW